MIPKDYNPLTDHTLAHDADKGEIDSTFRALPWMRRLHVNDRVITRDEWRNEKAQEPAQAQENGKHT